MTQTAASLTTRQLAVLHGLYQGLIETRRGAPTLYGSNVRRQLDTLADRAIIARTGMGAYMIPFGSPGAAIIAATPGICISECFHGRNA